ncbi:hypothetical protein HZB96_04940, partial [Candidatus Gottesmanbacteria bacterium]|nr:hypothetical protein [Candidatus Gottesmanbacteria bacterium]
MIKKSKKGQNNYFLGLTTGVLVAILVLKLVPILTAKATGLNLNFSLIPKPKATPTPDAAKLQAEVVKEVLPEKLDLGVTFGDTIINMVKFGAIDKEKFAKIYEGRGGLPPSEKKLLEEASDEKIVVTAQNSGLILNLLWPLGIANKTNVLAEGPMGTKYKNEVGNFASTGGWTLGKQDGGKLFNRFPLISLTPQQEATVKELAENIYRPCCGNSTYFPDCNHGAAMLGFLELAVAQGMPKEEIYKKALVLNSYWFPQTYAELAMYFKAKKGVSWDKVDPKVALGANYSSGQGYQAINKELQVEG